MTVAGKSRQRRKQGRQTTVEPPGEPASAAGAAGLLGVGGVNQGLQLGGLVDLVHHLDAPKRHATPRWPR